MTAFHCYLIANAARAPWLTALEDAVIAFGISMFSALSAMSYASYRADPWAALYASAIPSALLFFITLKSEKARLATSVKKPSDAPA